MTRQLGSPVPATHTEMWTERQLPAVAAVLLLEVFQGVNQLELSLKTKPKKTPKNKNHLALTVKARVD